MSCCKTSTGGIPRDVFLAEYKGVEVDEFGRSKTFKIFSCQRPWSRAFHASWVSFFVAFTGWFAIVPALEYLVRDKSNDITLDVKKTSNIVSVLGTIFVRFALGPVCESYGARRPMAGLLFFGGVLVMLSALVNTASGLLAIRFFIGVVGGTFVPCQYWTSTMFGSRVVGSANAFAGGWGNLGGGFALFFVGSLIMAIRNSGVDETLAWRYSMMVPGAIMFLVALPVFFFSDDCPQGSWKNRRYNDPRLKEEREKEIEASGKKSGSNLSTSLDYRVWLLAIVYASCFGVELAINNSLSSYLYRYFNTDIEGCSDPAVQTSNDYPEECSTFGLDTSSQIASLFGLMNLFARALGGIISDFMFSKMGMRGRLAVLFTCLIGEGAMLMIFSQVKTSGLAIFLLTMFSIFVQASEGATFAVVPFVNKRNIGVVAGIVGAGGNIGAVSWSTMFKAIDNQRDSYLLLGGIILVVAFLTALIPIQGVYMLGCSSPSTEEQDNDNASELSEDMERATEFDDVGEDISVRAGLQYKEGKQAVVLPEQSRSVSQV